MKREKEFKHLNRVELVEIIYQLQQDNQRLETQNAELEAKLASRALQISQAGSIAEAVVGLTDIFAKAQETADYYLEEIHRSNADLEVRCAEKILAAQTQADNIVQDAEYQAKKMLEQAARESDMKWQETSEKVNQLLRSHEALKGFLK